MLSPSSVGGFDGGPVTTGPSRDADHSGIGSGGGGISASEVQEGSVTRNLVRSDVGGDAAAGHPRQTGGPRAKGFPNMNDLVTVSTTDGVADVRLVRPDKRNALNGPMFRAIGDAIDRLRDDRSVRAVVLSGEGASFCAGLDIASFMGGGDSGETGERTSSFDMLGERPDGRITNLAQHVAHGWSELPMPVIAAVHGHALGGGIQIALGADIRIVAPDAKLSVMEIRWGLLPDMSGIPTLERLVGIDVAKELAFTGRIVSGLEAVELGIATRVSEEPREAALALAREIAGKNPHAIRGIKALANAAGTRPLADSFRDETRRMVELLGSANQLEAVTAELEGRPPNFVDPE